MKDLDFLLRKVSDCDKSQKLASKKVKYLKVEENSRKLAGAKVS